jgi:uncharacterized protein (TIGR02996 family)
MNSKLKPLWGRPSLRFALTELRRYSADSETAPPPALWDHPLLGERTRSKAKAAWNALQKEPQNRNHLADYVFATLTPAALIRQNEVDWANRNNTGTFSPEAHLPAHSETLRQLGKELDLEKELYSGIEYAILRHGYTRNPELEAWSRAIRANPEDYTTRLAFADWLREHGTPEHEKFADHVEADVTIHQLRAAGKPVSKKLKQSWYLTHTPSGGNVYEAVSKLGASLYPSLSTMILKPPSQRPRQRRLNRQATTATGSPLSGATSSKTPPSPSELKSRLRRFNRSQSPSLSSVLAILRSQQQVRLRGLAREIHESLGLEPSKVFDAVFLGTGPRSDTVQAIYHDSDPDQVRYAAAWYGYLTDSPGLGLFHVREKGPDSLYRIRLGLPADEASKAVSGFPGSVLLKAGDGFDALVADLGRQRRGEVESLGFPVEESEGDFETFADSDPAKTRKAFRDAITSYEKSSGKAD